jgi:uncharacterized ferritin-like protein (DUF455 family)
MKDSGIDPQVLFGVLLRGYGEGRRSGGFGFMARLQAGLDTWFVPKGINRLYSGKL